MKINYSNKRIKMIYNNSNYNYNNNKIILTKLSFYKIFNN